MLLMKFTEIRQLLTNQCIFLLFKNMFNKIYLFKYVRKFLLILLIRNIINEYLPNVDKVRELFDSSFWAISRS